MTIKGYFVILRNNVTKNLGVMQSSRVEQALLRTQELGIADRVSCFQSDLTSSFPLEGQKFDVVVGNFYFYGFTNFRINSRIVKNLNFCLDLLGRRQHTTVKIGDVLIIHTRGCQTRDRYDYTKTT